jgi:RHS repeat-associated protein
LQFFNHPEGYVENDNGTFKYHYQYKDHLGNIRLSYTNSGSAGSPNVVISEENNYYPFGLRHKGYNDIGNGYGNSAAKKYKFGGKELQDDNIAGNSLDWYDFSARNYDPALGRWMNLDPLAEQMRRHSPYNYAFNNPIFFIDYDGMAPDTVIANDKESQANIKNQLSKEDRKYVEFDENGELKADKLNESNNESGNLKNLRVLANSETVYEFHSGSVKVKDAKTGDISKVELSGTGKEVDGQFLDKGITLLNQQVGNNTSVSPNGNVQIGVNSDGTAREKAKTTAHEIVHAVAFELKALGINPNHEYGFTLPNNEGISIFKDKNILLKKEIKAREKEAYKNYDN